MHFPIITKHITICTKVLMVGLYLAVIGGSYANGNVAFAQGVHGILYHASYPQRHLLSNSHILDDGRSTRA